MFVTLMGNFKGVKERRLIARAKFFAMTFKKISRVTYKSGISWRTNFDNLPAIYSRSIFYF